MNHENIKEKEQKVAFLEKVINYLIFVNNEPLDVKPAKVVAGLEAEKTNNMFIAMHKAATAGHDFEAIAVKLKGGQPIAEQPQPQPSVKAKKEKPIEKPEKQEKPKVKEEPKEQPLEKPVPKVEEPKPEISSKKQPEVQPPTVEPTNTTEDQPADDGLRPTTAKTKPARKKKGDNFDKIVVEEKNAMPQGIIMDNEEDDHEEEKNTSFDHNVVANRNINADNINKKQHG